MNKLSIFCISDLHLEFYSSHRRLWDIIKSKLPLTNVLILAGDIGYPDKHYAQHYTNLLKLFKTIYPHVILVPGNHEYYVSEKFNKEDQLNKLSDICTQTGTILLNNSSTIINRTKFIGTTLWSSINEHSFKSMNDSNNVFKTMTDYNDEHQKCFQWLKQELDNDALNNEITNQVVITHHLPTYKLCHPKFQNSLYNSGFYTELLDKLNLTKTQFWFAGHTHEYIKIKHDNTTIVVNPLGYPHEDKETDLSSEIHYII